MGVENNECVVATTWDRQSMAKVDKWVGELSDKHQSLFAFLPSLADSKETVFLAPDGSKKGWEAAKDGKSLRDDFINFLGSFDNIDGSSPFDWVEVGYGEFGQTILRGNCKNRYDDRPYCHD